MKNLRKALSLALAVALSLSLVIVAGAKTLDEYTDKASIGKDYLEAVELLSALGVFEGDENGALNPQGTFTRAQAAKIVTYITIGSSAASLAPAPTDFSDVPASHWASGYVSFASQRGIINGVGGGKFDPDSPVTGAQLAKLLLVAIGYGAKGEYVGASWELNSIVDGQRLYILTGDANFSEAASREQAIQYVFNALKRQIVSYNQLFDAYLDASESQFVTIKQSNLAKETFNAESVPVYDDFGYEQHYWRAGNRDVTAQYITDVIVGSFVSNPGVSKGSLYADYQWEDTVQVWVNGWISTYLENDTTYFRLTPSSTFAAKGEIYTAAINAGDVASTALNGVAVDLIDTDDNGKIDKVVQRYEYLAKVTAVNIGGTVNISLIDSYNIAVGDGVNVTFTYVATDETFAKNDYVVVSPKYNSLTGYGINTTWSAYQSDNDQTPDVDESTLPTVGATVTARVGAEKILSVKPATIVRATPSSYTTVYLTTNINSITVNGEAKWVSAKEYMTSIGQGIAFVEGDFYLDSNGTIVGYDIPFISPSTLQYLFVRGYQKDEFSTPRIAATLAVDGTKLVYELVTNSSGVVGAEPVQIAAGNYGWYSYTLNSEGKAQLTTLVNTANAPDGKVASTKFTTDFADVSNIASAAALVNRGTPQQPIKGDTLSSAAGYTATSSTKLYVNGRLYTGYAAFPVANVDSDTYAMFVLASSSTDSATPTNAIAAIYVLTGTAVSGEYGVVTMFSNGTVDGYMFFIKTVAHPEGELMLSVNNLNAGQTVSIVTAADGTRSVGAVDTPKAAISYNQDYSIADTSAKVAAVDIDSAGIGYILVDGDGSDADINGTGGGYYLISAETVFYNSRFFGENALPEVGNYVSVYAPGGGSGTYGATTPTAYAIVFDAP
jgi:hypothetical protein